MSPRAAPALLLAAAAAWAGGAGAQGLGDASSDKPIEITADRLDVAQGERLATFAGNVNAVQGDLVLRSDRLKVYYGSAAGDGAQAARGAGGPGNASPPSIRRIEAEGGVVVTSPDEVAEGRSGVYDVANGTVTLTGAVVLTRQENVIRGDRLVYNLRTGRAEVTADTPAVAEREGGRPARVRALFVPGSDGGSSGGQPPTE